ncbi:MAG: hypothetical protein KBG47_01185 [Bacteroidia bacterium]|jgi:hypothetical protein|nr:hypothetical protein [Sphingobacteriaceae bacterium]MBK7310220.1 hypothetical protein [Sphingobacteriaceae bacterium]MBK7817910.1 hypothetical protein [Sphingobacteriaceae bacterium]MBP9068088.1 hypothetical protein [Bacteroidia bacterium]
MTSTALKKKIHEYIDITDDKILMAVYTLLEAQAKASENKIEFNDDMIKELDKRRKLHLSGKSKSYSFEEIKKQVLSKHKK